MEGHFLHGFCWFQIIITLEENGQSDVLWCHLPPPRVFCLTVLFLTFTVVNSFLILGKYWFFFVSLVEAPRPQPSNALWASVCSGSCGIAVEYTCPENWSQVWLYARAQEGKGCIGTGASGERPGHGNVWPALAFSLSKWQSFVRCLLSKTLHFFLVLLISSPNSSLAMQTARKTTEKQWRQAGLDLEYTQSRHF